VSIANFWSFPKGGFTWPDRLTRHLLRRIGLLLFVGCLLELERLCVGDVAVAGNMGFSGKLVLGLITKSYMGSTRIFLASSVNNGSVVNLASVYSSSARMFMLSRMSLTFSTKLRDGNVPDIYSLGIELLVPCCLICQCDELTHSFLRRRNVGFVEIVSDDIDGRHARRIGPG
jgi:hypothetical protein